MSRNCEECGRVIPEHKIEMLAYDDGHIEYMGQCSHDGHVQEIFPQELPPVAG